MKYILTLMLIFAFACKSDLPVKEVFPDITLTNHEGGDFIFSNLRGKVLVVSYIYTHCPDICHLIGKRMNVFKESLNDAGIHDKVYFVSISFDPKRDTPEVLRNHARMMNLDLKNWVFLTGDENSVNSTIEAAGMEAIDGPTKFNENGEPSYSIAHRDRISLVDKKGRIRKHYKGTKFDMEELLGDIKTLL